METEMVRTTPIRLWRGPRRDTAGRIARAFARASAVRTGCTGKLRWAARSERRRGAGGVCTSRRPRHNPPKGIRRSELWVDQKRCSLCKKIPYCYVACETQDVPKTYPLLWAHTSRLSAGPFCLALSPSRALLRCLFIHVALSLVFTTRVPNNYRHFTCLVCFARHRLFIRCMKRVSRFSMRPQTKQHGPCESRNGRHFFCCVLVLIGLKQPFHTPA